MRTLLILITMAGSVAHAELFSKATYFNVVPNSTTGSWSILLFDGNRQIKSDPIPSKSKAELEDIAFEAKSTQSSGC